MSLLSTVLCGDIADIRAGQKRTSSSENFDEYRNSKRISSAHYANYQWTEGTSDSTSPKSPESGIDMNDLGCSPPCYPFSRSIPSNPFDNSQSTELPNMTNLQPEQAKDGFYLIIVDEPEENYRARYDSEGCRGPMKGRNGGCPTVQIISNHQHHWKCADIKVELVATDRSPLNSCKLDSSDEGTNLLKKAQPGERISFENLRIRRLKKGDATTRGASIKQQQQSKQAIKGTRSKQDEKVAYLLFTAIVMPAFSSEAIELKALSQAIYLNASHDPPEIHCVVPHFASSGDQVAIIGTRMHSPRVSFIVCVDGKEQEIPADINKEVSHQNALVIKVPHLPMNSYCTNNVANTQICVTAGKGDRTGKEPLKSNLMQFYCVVSGLCKECVMTHQPSMYRPSQPHSMVYRRFPNQPTPSPPPVNIGKCAMLNPARPTISAKPRSPRPLIPSSPGGYGSPPPSNSVPMTSSCSTTFNSFPVNAFLPVCQSPPQISIPSAIVGHANSHPSSDMDILTSFCSPQTNTTSSRSPQASPSFCGTVVPSESVMGFSDSHSGPVSPDEFNCYLPNNNSQGISGGTFGSSPISCSQQDYANVYSSGSAASIGMVQPGSLGQFTQNP